ncbi:MAG: hypothetical protein A2X86_18700 [Bdellovibrionales bacterium GWA2_49_15]|nr:MAG: hypothetical protein A2X86_18700 [Bdellovibrionales bacterium GWA2_49_15]HAZ14257.1 hypothetical protein [Bdellovibrionales bacterium]
MPIYISFFFILPFILGLMIFMAPFERFWDRYAVRWKLLVKKNRGESQISLKNGRKLLFMFSELELCSVADIARLEMTVRNLPPYKSFHLMARSMAQTFRSLGCGLQDLSFLRECLSLDLKLEERCQRILKNSRTQYFILGLFSLFFALVMKSYLQTEAQVISLPVLICLCQLFGVLIGDRITRIYHKRFFADVDEWFHGLLKLHALSSAGGNLASLVPDNVAPLMRRAKAEDLKEVARALEDILERWREWGGALAPEIQGLLRFLHDIREIRFYKFERLITLLNFILMVLLFLGGHLMHMGVLFSGLI